MRRKPGTLTQIEQSLMIGALSLRRRGIEEFHGFGLAKEIQELTGSRLLTAHGTIYRALRKLEQLGYLRSRWEDPTLAADENRPRRRLYKLAVSEATVISKLDNQEDGLMKYAWGTSS